MDLILLAVFSIAGSCAFLSGKGRYLGPGLALLSAALTLYFASLIPQVAEEPLHWRTPWVAPLQLTLSFYLDGLALMFCLLISGIGALVYLYSDGYLGHQPYAGRFYGYLTAFLGSMLGLVVADNIVLLFVFWELTSISSYFLIGFYHEQASSRSAALKALLTTGLGGAAMLVGLAWLGVTTGQWDLSALVHMKLPAGNSIALILILLGAFTKSAQFPFHYWLPAAMSAPAPVSSFLHSATMVKAGVYLLCRMNPLWVEHPLWRPALMSAGAVTMVGLGALALTHTDAKRVLAYSTASMLGTLVFLLGVGTPEAIAGLALLLIAHALYKAALFQVAGIYDVALGTRDLLQLTGRGHTVPWVGGVAAVAAASMIGISPFLGGVGKAAVSKALTGWPFWWLLVGSALSTAAALLVSLRPFVGPSPEKPPVSVNWRLLTSPLILAGLGLVGGLGIGSFGVSIVRPTAEAILGHGHSFQFSPWSGALSGMAKSGLLVALAGIFVWRWADVLRLGQRFAWFGQWGPDRWYEWTLSGVVRTAGLCTGFIQNGRLRTYLFIVFGSFILLVAASLSSWPGLSQLSVAFSATHGHELALALVILAALVFVLLSSSRIVAVFCLGTVGYGVAILFVLFSAPDLGMTQFIVETLTLLLFVFAFRHLPDARINSRWQEKLAPGLFSVAVGVVTFSLALVSLNHAKPEFISRYFTLNSVPLGHGQNVVNVVLVDFRALDTLGEIVVLGTAAIGVSLLLSKAFTRKA